jgi:hypothetical protein
LSPEREQRAFEAVLSQELAKPGTLLQTVLYGPEQAVEVMRLAARQYRRALRTPITRARNEMMYSRPRVVTVRELRQFFEAGSCLLPALQDGVERKIQQPALLPTGSWAVPDLS